MCGSMCTKERERERERESVIDWLSDCVSRKLDECVRESENMCVLEEVSERDSSVI